MSHSTLAGFIRPPRLRPGDVIGIVAPSSPQRDDERLKRGMRYFEQLGYRVEVGEHVWARRGYLAGTDEQRVSDLNRMIRDPRVRMIIAGRGGYGVMRILDRVDYPALRRDPKVVVGFSDVTALNLSILRQARMVSFSGAMPGVDFFDSARIDPLTEETFWRAVTSVRPLGSIATPADGCLPLRRGTGEGWLLAGNLTMIVSLAGTRWLPKSRGAVLLIEEIGEESYRVDRLLSQLLHSGGLRGIAGLALGAFTDAEPKRVSVEPLPLEEVLGHYLELAGAPAVGGVRYGHIAAKLTLPLGVMARLDGTRGEIRLGEAGVS